MEGHSMIMNGKNLHHQDDHSAQSNSQTQCHPHRTKITKVYLQLKSPKDFQVISRRNKIGDITLSDLKLDYLLKYSKLTATGTKIEPQTSETKLKIHK